MSKRLPSRLRSEPLLEVVSEVRFDAVNDAAVSLLPGILHQKLGPFDRQTRLWPLSLPVEALTADPSLAFRPHIAIGKDNWTIRLGPKVVSVSCVPPYPGWTAFRRHISEVFDVVCAQSFIHDFNWISLKYIDVIKLDGVPPTLDCLDARLELGPVRLDVQPTHLRVEYREDETTTIVQVASPIVMQRDGQSHVEGVLVDVDTIYRQHLDSFSSQYLAILDDLHDKNKKRFFSLLTEDTLSRLGPEYS